MPAPINTCHLLVSDLYPGDAIGNFVLAIHDFLSQRNLPVALYAERYGDTLSNVSSYTTFFERVQPGDTLLYQLSNHDPALSDIMAAPCRKVIYYHNITPGHFFAPYSPETAVLLDKGRAELPLVASADVLLANSHYSLAEVAPYRSSNARCSFFPPFLHSQLEALSSPKPLPTFAPQGPYLLTLGRVVPHKRIEDALHIFSLLRKYRPELSLVIAGSQYEPYAHELIEYVSEENGLKDTVLFTGKIPAEDVSGLLRHASGLLHTSAHEGFCMPVLEAMLLNIPVFAYKQEAVAETLGQGGLLLHRDTPEQAAQSIQNYLQAPDFNQRILAAQAQRGNELCSLAKGESLFAFLHQTE